MLLLLVVLRVRGGEVRGGEVSHFPPEDRPPRTSRVAWSFQLEVLVGFQPELLPGERPPLITPVRSPSFIRCVLLWSP